MRWGDAGFQPTTICTPTQLMEDIQMKEVSEKHPKFDPETYTDPILEECTGTRPYIT